jgi:hypothetical protein
MVGVHCGGDGKNPRTSAPYSLCTLLANLRPDHSCCNTHGSEAHNGDASSITPVETVSDWIHVMTGADCSINWAECASV